MLHMEIFISLAFSFTITFFIVPAIIKVAREKHLFDEPNHRSAAKEPIPNLGGIAIMAGFIIAMIVATDHFNINEFKYYFIAVITLFLIGLKDDLIGISARKKFIVQFAVALYLVFMGSLRITNLHGILGINEIGFWSGSILTIFLIVGLVNAVNLVDGIDGLAGGLGLQSSLVFGFWFLNNNDFIHALLCFSLAGSLIAFLLYNLFGHKNKIFMGDTGSLILGVILSILVIRFNELQLTGLEQNHGLPALSLAIVIVPIVDTLRIFSVRLLKGKSPFKPDMNHVHHHLLKLTQSHLIASLLIIISNALLIIFAFSIIDYIGNSALFFLLLTLGFIMAAIPSILNKMLKENSFQLKSLFTFFLSKNNQAT